MSITYKAIKKVTRTNPPKEQYYAFAHINEEINLDQIASNLSDGSTTRRADVYAVLVGMVDYMKHQLCEGKRIRLGELGSFAVTLKSDGSETEAELSTHHIKGCRLQYRPSKTFKRALHLVDYKKVSKRKK
jgi:predicted histone-like DNA-binding protein